MGQGATRPETPRERQEREALEADLESSPVRGRPLRQRLRNFRPDAESGVRALGGPTAWMRRLRAIEDAVDQHERQLAEAWRTLAEEREDPVEFAAAWRELAEGWSFAKVNGLIERHNRNFPAEARLPMDPRTRVLLQGPIVPTLLRMAWPNVLVMVAQAATAKPCKMRVTSFGMAGLVWKAMTKVSR